MTEPIRILVVDDEDSVRKRCVRLLARKGYDVVGAKDGSVALDIIRKISCDLVVADIRMPGMDGIELLKKIREFNGSMDVIMMTGYAAVETAVQAMKCGASDYLAKPFDVDEFLHVVGNVAEKQQLRREMNSLRRRLHEQEGESFLMGNSPAINEVRRFIDKVAAVNCNILLVGESGAGKNLVAKTIHASSPRSRHEYVVADCAALSGALLESELFGHVKGAFTGAYADRKGYFETAADGTIFLDEVGELPLDLQGKLLRAVEENIIFRLGSSRPVRVNVRVIAATNKDLEDLVRNRLFREDLFYRLNVVGLKIPPLRDRVDDIPLLVKHFANKHSAELGLARVPKFGEDMLNSLKAYAWPGNVRELENAVQRSLVLADDGRVLLRHLVPPEALGAMSGSGSFLQEEEAFKSMRSRVVQEFTHGYVESCLKRFKGNVTQTAQAIGMRRTSVQRLLKKLGLNAGDFRQ
ncbi:MAG: sigma-54 dependent transcriptional regulator [Pseudomonadota bacterium]